MVINEIRVTIVEEIVEEEVRVEQLAVAAEHPHEQLH
jgi:hypothetical protein